MRAPGANPGPQVFHAMVYDDARQRVVMCGGETAETWEWDGSNWAMRAGATGPGQNERHAMAYDVSRQRVVLFGAQTWEWDGSKWKLLAPANSPGARGDHAMVYDVARQRVVLFGGASASGSLADTWEWDGSNWTQRSPTNSPWARRDHAMAYDVSRQRVVLFGGHGSDTWEWDGSNWTQRSPASSPGWRFAHAMAYDAARQRVVLHGGQSSAWNGTLGDTWEWDGNNWTQRGDGVAISGHSMVYDDTRQRLVLFGGQDSEGEYLDFTLEWDDARSFWAWIGTTTAPSARSHHAAAYDVAHQRVVLFGGTESSGDTWLYGPYTPTRLEPFGTRCSRSASTPTLSGRTPYLGNSEFALELIQARPSSACVFGLSMGTQARLIGACVLYLADPIIPLVAVSNLAGFAETPHFAVPFDVSLRGMTLFAQAFVVDQQGPVPGVEFSAGLKLTLGD